MADYRDHYEEIRATGADLVAASVDGPDKSEALRRQLRLPFVVLCDTRRRVVRDWDIYNPREKGGIAKPSVFIIGPDRRVKYASVDTVATRVPASEIVRLLQSGSEIEPARRKLYIPRFSEWVRAVRNAFRR